MGPPPFDPFSDRPLFIFLWKFESHYNACQVIAEGREYSIPSITMTWTVIPEKEASSLSFENLMRERFLRSDSMKMHPISQGFLVTQNESPKN